MIGTPYWGDDTFSDIRNIVNLKCDTLTLEKITDLCKSKGILIDIQDKYTLFLTLSQLDMLYIIEDEGTWLSWCRDIRFNYRDRFVFIPYYIYDSETVSVSHSLKGIEYIDKLDDRTMNVRHNFELRTCVVDSRSRGYTVNTLFLYDKDSKTKYRLDIPDLKYLNQESFSLKDLTERYIHASYILPEGVVAEDWLRYLSINKRKGGKEQRLRSQLKLKKYSPNFTDISYTDVRQYQYEELFGTNLIDDIKPYWLRLYEFEAYLYCLFGQGLSVEEEDYRKDFSQLGVSKRFLTYKEGIKPLTLKYYYKDNVSLRRKSFERFK